MEITFRSKLYPDMELFLAQLERALSNLPGGSRPKCTGLYFCFCENKEITEEEIGFVLEQNKVKYSRIARKGMTQTLFQREIIHQDFENSSAQVPGVICRNPDSYVSVFGHDSNINKAISVLWSVARDIKTCTQEQHHHNFWATFYQDSVDTMKRFFPENDWIGVIAKLMKEM